MRFGRRRETEAAEVEATSATEDATTSVTTGPFDIGDVDVEGDGVDRLDVGSLLVTPGDARQVQLQVDERTRAVQAVLVANQQGALEVRAFAAPTDEPLWPEMRADLTRDATERGGTVTEREGRWGTELVCHVPVTLSDGRKATSLTRVIGIDGPRWLLRATCHGQPAASPDEAGDWEDVLATVVVRRGTNAMPAGDQLPFTLPPQAQRPG